MGPTELLARSELFAGTLAKAFEPLMRTAVTRRYRRRELIWHAGDPAGEMYLVISGEVIVSRLGPGGEEYVVEAFVAGDVMGQLHFFEHAPTRMLDAQAAEPTSCWIVPRADVLHLLDQRPELMRAMLRTYSRWVVERHLHDADSSFRNVSAQVATKLVHLAERFGEPSDRGVRIGLRITETTLANMIGASRENVSRAIARLQRAGELHRAKGRIYLVDPDLMRRRYSWVTAEEARSVREAAALHSVTFNTDLKKDPT